MAASSSIRSSISCVRCRALRVEPLEDRRMLSVGGFEASSSQAVEVFHAQDALFAENAGQWDAEDVYFGYNKGGTQIFFTDESIEFGLSRRELKEGVDPAVVEEMMPGGEEDLYEVASTHFSLNFDGAQPVVPVGADQAATVFNYHLGSQENWVDGVATYKTVIYDDLYEGIDLHTFSRHGQMKYEFHVAPGADWSEIQLSYDGIEGLSIGEDGSLCIETELGTLVDEGLYVYQIIGGEEVEVASGFALVDGDTYAFAVTGEYDPSLELVIDPELEWSTYLGGAGEDGGGAVATDDAGNVYVGGSTQSSDWVSGGWDTTYSGSTDGYVAMLSPSGMHLWSTYVGGANDDSVRGIAADDTGNVYVAGDTNSIGWISGGWDESFGGDLDGFVAKISPSGAHIWSSYLGASGRDDAGTVAIDDNGNLYAGGGTHSDGWISGGWDTSQVGVGDAYVVKLSPSGDHLWSSYMGGSWTDWTRCIATDSEGNAFVVGVTATSSSWVSGGWDTTHAGGPHDGFVVKFSPSGEHLWSSYIGGTGDDRARGVATDNEGNVYIVGQTKSSNWASGGWDTSYEGVEDGFVVKLSSSGDHLWSSYFGGENEDISWAVDTDAEGNAYVVGWTQTSEWVSGGWDTSHNGGEFDGAVVKFSPTGEHVWSSVLGGANSEWINNVTVDNAGNVYLGGHTDSTDFPAAINAYQGGTYDAFVAKVRTRMLDLVSGTLWNDFNGDGTRQANEPPLAGWTVLLDANGNGEHDDGEYLAETDESGRYRIAGIAEGTYVLTPIVQGGWEVTLPAEGVHPVTIDGATLPPAYDFGLEPAPLPRLYVDADAAPNGLGFSWETAFNSLQTAVTLASLRNADHDPANDVSEIWIAEGMYRPSQQRVAGTARTETFSLVDGVMVYGGFAGTEQAIDEREILEDGTFAHPTVLSGDIGTIGNKSDNAYHVVYVPPLVNAGLDGVTVRDGNSNDAGGGIAVWSEAILTARNLVVVSNDASVHGGGIANLGQVTLFDSSVSNNMSGQGAGIVNWGLLTAERVTLTANSVAPRHEAPYGGALYNATQGEAVFTSCEFADNTAWDGGAIYNLGTTDVSDSVLTRNAARNDAADSDGGGIYNIGTASFVDSALVGNIARDNGGAAYSTGTLAFTACDVRENRSERDDCGGVYTNQGRLHIESSSFVRNSAPDAAGALWATKSETTIIDSRFEGNTSRGNGAFAVLGYGAFTCVDSVIVGNRSEIGVILGGSYVPGEAAPPTTLVRMTNTTIVANQVPEDGQLISPMDGVFELSNSILALNSPDSGFEMVGTFVASNNLIDVDPGFVRNPSPGSDGQWGTEDDDYGDLRLLETSPAVDAGNSNLLPNDQFDQDKDGDTVEPLPLDIGGLPRVLGNSVDIGANELNRVPVAVDDSFDVIEDTVLLLTEAALMANDSDSEGMPLLVVAVTPGEGLPGTLSWEGGVITFKPRTDFLGLASFDYTIADPLGAQSTATVTIKVVPIPGDLNRDGLVNSRDLDIVRAWWGMSVAPGTLSEGDANADGKVGSADLDIVRANWGNAAPPSASAGAEMNADPLTILPRTPVYGPVRSENSARASLSDAALEDWNNPETGWLQALEALEFRSRAKVKTAVTRGVMDLVLEGWA